MSFPSTLPAAILETILTGLATLFLAGAGNDTTAARHAASHMLVGYHPENEDELRLAASIISFGFQSLGDLAQAAAPDIPLTRVVRLHRVAIGLSREAGRAERRLGQLQTARRKQASAEASPEPAQSQPKPNTTPAAIPVPAKIKELTWTQAYEVRQREARIAASLKRAEARVAAMENPPIPAVPDNRCQLVARPSA